MNDFVKILEEINEHENIYILSHINPDGDSIGSSLAMYHYLRLLDKNVKIPKVDKVPEDYKFLPGIDKIKPLTDIDEDYAIITVDSASPDRLGKNKELLEKANKIINIDHHKSNSNFGDINLVLANASSTGEVIFKMLSAREIKLNQDIATAIYTAISSDTGSFMYSNTSQETHEIVARLYDYNIDIDKINQNLYQSESLNRVRLFSDILLNIGLYFDNRLAIGKVSNSMLEDYNLSSEDTEGLVEEIRNIKEVDLAILLKERDEKKTRVSARSKGLVDVSEFCKKFGGGGHARAAGCSIDHGLEKTEEIIVEEVKRLWKEY